MNILDNPLPMSHLRRRKRMHLVPQVRNSRPAHLLLVCDRGDSELARLFLFDCERRDLCLLVVHLPVDAVATNNIVSIIRG